MLKARSGITPLVRYRSSPGIRPERKIRFAPDSPVEGDGFEPSVAHKKQPFWLPPFGPAIRLPQQKPGLSCRGPMVRIHLPPAASQVRTCLSWEFAFLRRE